MKAVVAVARMARRQSAELKLETVRSIMRCHLPHGVTLAMIGMVVFADEVARE